MPDTTLPTCPECFQLTEKVRRLESNLKRTQADLQHWKLTGHAVQVVQSEDAAEMPDPDIEPEKTDPTQRYVKRPPLEF